MRLADASQENETAGRKIAKRMIGNRGANHKMTGNANAHLRSAANPEPTPDFFVGVLTDTKMRSASIMPLSTSVEKNRFLPLAWRTTSSSPGS